ncbi:uncharacterized protein KY384_002541 [Bacidia gigantensis]|uniref:uncharacterized protein n=1 Tax=Bacidia gigantensis TaxID=2732470 RepID=UPI001D03A3E6|nr:uncharacterized protein KY384_002541 [Bacidia gigantensis]KAG8532664.1 hypothetical protein KY384_002541 [Bacidia gigantensis]
MNHKAPQDHAMAVPNGDVPKINGVHSLSNGVLTNGLALDQSEEQHEGREHRSSDALQNRYDTISEMSEIQVVPPQSNGNVNNAKGSAKADEYPPNVQKKVRMFDLANSRRAQFIKLLVLSRWARHADNISKVIDLRVWLTDKQTAFQSAVDWMGELKRKLATIKEPSPDTNTALEILSLGRASWIPDLTYLPAEALTPPRMLENLRRINTLLSIRLRLHEKIPSNLRDFSISSGRATFRVSEEFEVDLSIADEDTSKQLYFIDLRFTFSPMVTSLPAGRLRDEFEAKANDALGRDGLLGLFDYIHNIVLTQKLTILRNQAQELARGHWAEHLKVEPLRRSVVVQYWCDRQGAKHWIEIGIIRGKTKRIAYADEEQRIPKLGVRWFRGGKEVSDVQVDLRLGEISMRHILEQVITRHINSDMSEMATGLRRGQAYSSGRLRLKAQEGISKPSEAYLLVQLTSSKAIKLSQEPVSGRFAILPSSKLSSRAEYELNRLAVPANEGASQLSFLRALTTHEEVSAGAIRLGWDPLPSLRPNQETIQRLFTKGNQHIKFFKRHSWASGWALAFSASLDGDQWWVVETSETPIDGEQSSKTTLESTIRKAYSINTAQPSSSPEPLSSYLIEVERCAAGTISQSIDSRYMASTRMPHKLQAATSLDAIPQCPSLYLRLPAKKDPQDLTTSKPLDLRWAQELVKLDYQGLSISHSCAVHLATTCLEQPLPNMKDLAANVPGAAFHPSSGAFALQLQTQIGQSVIPQLSQRISGIGRLHDFITIIKGYKLLVTRISISSLDFTYLENPQKLKAVIHFPADGPLQMSLLQPNPHLRILDHLNSRFRTKGLAHVLSIMQITLSLLFTLARLESARKSSNMNILVRSESWYQVIYSATSPVGGFDIVLRRRRDTAMWFIPEDTIKPPFIYDEAKDIRRGKGNGWRGVKGGIITELNGIHEAMERLDAVYSRAAEHAAGQSRKGKRKAEDEVVEID